MSEVIAFPSACLYMWHFLTQKTVVIVRSEAVLNIMTDVSDRQAYKALTHLQKYIVAMHCKTLAVLANDSMERHGIIWAMDINVLPVSVYVEI